MYFPTYVDRAVYPNFWRHTALSVPITNRSIRLAAHDTGLPGEKTTPPRDSHPPQLDPFHHRCQTALSPPRAKISKRFGPQETAVGGEVRRPPRDSHPPQLEPFHHLCQSA